MNKKKDTWGGDIVTSAIAHLAHSTPVKNRFSSTDFNSYNTVSNAFGGNNILRDIYLFLFFFVLCDFFDVSFVYLFGIVCFYCVCVCVFVFVLLELKHLKELTVE